MRSNVITPKQLVADAKGKERFMPPDIAFDNLELYATKGCMYEVIERMPVGMQITRLRTNKWCVESLSGGKPIESSSLKGALRKAGLL